MNKILLVCGSEKSQNALAELFKGLDRSDVSLVSTGSAARRLLYEKDFDLVLINTPLPDEFGHELASIASHICPGVLLIVREELENEVTLKVQNDGIFVLTRPLSRTSFYQAVRLAQSAGRKVQLLMEENRQLREKIDEMKLVNRAKTVLMNHLNFTEEQAHRYIEKQAMDRRMTKRAVSEGILNTYED